MALSVIEPASIDDLKAAIEAMHVGMATFFQAVSVRGKYFGNAVWEGVVHALA